MASPLRLPARSLKEELKQRPERFQFFQAVRLLRLMRQAELGNAHAREPGKDAHPEQECVQFSGNLSQHFPAVEIASLSGDLDDAPPPQMTVTVMGLFGAMGVLPTHDTQRLIDDRRDSRFERDFLDLFNHRVLSLFYRAWAKNYLPVQYEQTFGQHQQALKPTDVITQSLLSLAGVGLKETQHRLSFPDTLLAKFAAHFSGHPKCGSALCQMINDMFGVSTRLTHFVGQWIPLDQDNRSEMPTPDYPTGQHCQLGMSFVLGDRVWDVANRFRITLGPLKYAQLLEFCPWNQPLKALFELIRCYVGPQLEYDVQLELLAAEIPPAQLNASQALGVNTWLFSSQPIENSLDVILTPESL